jgi:hypothetical protein
MDFGKLFGKKKKEAVDIPELDSISLSKDEMAELLKVSPEALEAFEAAYNKEVLSHPFQDLLDPAIRQKASKAKEETKDTDISSAQPLIERIVEELVGQTKVYVYDGEEPQVLSFPALPDASMLAPEDVNSLQGALRPNLTGALMQKDVNGDTAGVLLWYYKRMMAETDPKKKQFCYNHFRQGLDILDLDGITYEIIGTNKNSMGHWLPPLVEACRTQSFFKIPKTRVAKVPLTMLQLTRLQYESLTPTTLRIVDEWAKKVFALDPNGEYFVKTGTFSSKFDFRNAHVAGKEVNDLGEYLLFVHYQALQMASPLCTPCIYGVSTTNEWVVREFIPDKEQNLCIYKGMPLHTEYRVFVDCDSDEVLAIAPYWDPETMKKRFASGSEKSPHDAHDYVIYKAHEETLMRRYHENCEKVKEKVREMLPSLNLTGQWSVDIMQNGDDFWLIDMAVAESSAFYDHVPQELRRPMPEDWIPRLEEAK